MITKTCVTCHREFSIYPCHEDRNPLYCSRSCKKTGKTLICKTCGKSFYKAKRLLEKYNIQYCSKACRIRTTCNICDVKLTTSNTYVRKSGPRKGQIPNKRCKQCSIKQVGIKDKLRKRRKKQELVNLCGGKCSTCGYHKNYASLAFHHINPSTKSFNINQLNMNKYPWKRILKEVKKCILLCHNCHYELHHPELSIL